MYNRPMPSPYANLAKAIQAAGFVTTEMPLGPHGHRLVCAARQHADGSLAGSSFWITFRSGKWFLGTWAPRVYRIPFPEQVQELCLSWLKLHTRSAKADVPERLKDRFCLLEADDAGLLDELH